MMTVNAVLAVAAAIAGVDGAPASESTRTPDRELAEVTVLGSHDLSSLRQSMIDAEDRFYARYNELNPVDEFDVSCREEARTGTRLRKRICRGLYEDRALAEEGVEAFKIRQFIHDPGIKRYMPASPPVPASVAIEARRPGFQRNMREVVSKDEQLLQLLAERAVAIERFEVARRAAFEPEGSRGRPGDPVPANGSP